MFSLIKLQSARSDTHTERIKLWENEKGENVVTNLDENNLSDILNNIMTLESKRTIFQEDINKIAEHMANRAGSYFPKGGHSATQTQLKV